MFFLLHHRKALAIVLMLFFTSCATYHQQASGYYALVSDGKFDEASKALEENALLKKNRNRLLYLMEKGKMLHLLHRYDESNRYLNEADHLMEDARTSAKDILAGTLVNPMMQSYKGEDFEKYLVHYYKALNYLQLNHTEEALVEARRISLRTYSQQDKAGQSSRYAEDAFSLMLQGMIYEKAGNINDAFISYRNAVDLFLDHKGIYYGIHMPSQLKQDLLRTAYLMEFFGELSRYEDLLDLRWNTSMLHPDGELILFWENGFAPVKTEQNLFFSLRENGEGNFVFVDDANTLHIPFDFSSGYKREDIKSGRLNTFRVAFPKYIARDPAFSDAYVQRDGFQHVMEVAQDVNELAFATLEERKMKELSKSLTRLAIKKLAEEAARADEDEKDKGKKNRQNAISMGLQVYNFASEKADTRNWQSLPHSIYYTRIPLRPGENTFTFSVKCATGAFKTDTLRIHNRGGLQFLNVCSYR